MVCVHSMLEFNINKNTQRYGNGDFQKGSGQDRCHTMPQRNIALSVGTICVPNLGTCAAKCMSRVTILFCNAQPQLWCWKRGWLTGFSCKVIQCRPLIT